MFKTKKVAITSKWFPLPYADENEIDHYTLKRLKKLLQDSLEEPLRLTTKVNKNTEILIVGSEPDESMIEEAKNVGAEIMTAEEFLGFKEFSSFKSLKEFFEYIRDNGFVVSTTTNEGGRKPVVVSLPIEDIKKNDSDLNLMPFFDDRRIEQSEKLEINAQNTVLKYINEHYNDYFSESPVGDCRPIVDKDLSQFFDPQKHDSPNYWIGKYCFSGSTFMGNVTIENKDHFVAPYVYEYARCKLIPKKVRHADFNFIFRDSSHSGSMRHLMTIGGIENGRKMVTFLIFEVIHT